LAKLIFVVTEDWYFVSHRLPLAIEAVRQGYEVVLVTRISKFRRHIEQNGIRVVPFNTNRQGLNPIEVLREAVALARIYRREKPDLVHHVALRPVVVGALAARLSRVSRVVSAITGMGFLFTGGERKPLVRKIVSTVLPHLISHGVVIVQNLDDSAQITKFGVPSSKVRRIAGVGVDTEAFVPSIRNHDRTTVLMASRLLWDKGVGEFVEAARLLKHSGARFVLAGMVDTKNPAGVPREQVDAWTSQGLVEWWGHQEDMAATLALGDIFCLPSYREGLPKVLLEAMSSGLPCVSTDVPGCRDVVRHGDTGLLVPAGDSAALASAIADLINNEEQRLEMGRRGRKRVVEGFSEARTISATMRVYKELMA